MSASTGLFPKELCKPQSETDSDFTALVIFLLVYYQGDATAQELMNHFVGLLLSILSLKN